MRPAAVISICAGMPLASLPALAGADVTRDWYSESPSVAQRPSVAKAGGDAPAARRGGQGPSSPASREPGAHYSGDAQRAAEWFDRTVDVAAGFIRVDLD